MSTALARSVDVTNFDTLERLSNVLAKAQDACPKAFFGKPATVAAVILFGQEVGLTPMMALRSVHVISGKMTMSAELMLTLALQRGVKKKWTEATNEAATLVLIRDGEEMLPVRFTLDDAKRAELLSNPTWKKFPGNMLKARCISNAIRMHCPDVLGPCIYSEEEMRDLEEAAPISATPAPSQREEARAALIRPAVDGEASVAPAGVFLGDLSDAPDSGMRGEQTKSAIRHCATIEALQAWLKHRAQFIVKATPEQRERITSVIEKMSARVNVEPAMMLDAAGLLGAKSMSNPITADELDAIDTTATETK